jgi:hypothetical protein
MLVIVLNMSANTYTIVKTEYSYMIKTNFYTHLTKVIFFLLIPYYMQ